MTVRPEWSRRELIGVGISLGLLVLLLFAFGTERVGLQKDDAGQYYQMAESTTYLARLPYSFRVLSPLIASAWPRDLVAAFTIITLVSLTLAATALYAYQRAIAISPPAAYAGATLFVVSGGAVRMLTTPVYVDGLTYLAEAAGFLFLALGWFWPFILTLVVGTLNRETTLLLIPLYLVLTPASVRPLWRSLTVVVAPMLALGVVVVAKLWVGGILSGDQPWSTLAPFARTFRQDLPPLTDLFDLWSTFGVVWLLAAKNLPGPTAFQRRALVFGALVILQLIVSRGDEGRNLSHLFVLVIPLAMLEAERIRVAAQRLAPMVLAAFVIACAASMVHARWTFVEPTVLRYALVAAGTVAAIGMMAVTTARLTRRGHRVSSISS